MKYKDYYQTLGVERSATAEEIQKAYRKLARQYHPDVSKEAGAEEKFKEVGEAYATLSDPKQREAYDRLGDHPSGEEFRPPPEWQRQYGEPGASFEFDDIDLGELFAGLRGFGAWGGASGDAGARGARGGAGFRGPGMNVPLRGQDVEVSVPISLEEAYRGTSVDLDLRIPQVDERGALRQATLAFTARIPQGATDGERLRVPGKGGPGLNGGPPGDLFLNVELKPHKLFRVSGHDVYLDLPLTPWEAVLGTTVELPTPLGAVQLKIPAGTKSGQQLRLAKRGLARAGGDPGDLFAVVRIAVPEAPSVKEQELMKLLAESSTFNPRAHFGAGGAA